MNPDKSTCLIKIIHLFIQDKHKCPKKHIKKHKVGRFDILG